MEFKTGQQALNWSEMKADKELAQITAVNSTAYRLHEMLYSEKRFNRKLEILNLRGAHEGACRRNSVDYLVAVYKSTDNKN